MSTPSTVKPHNTNNSS